MIYAVLWAVVIGLILFRFNPAIHVLPTLSSSHGTSVMGFMIFYGPLFFILYLMTGFIIEVREQYVSLNQLKGYLRKRRISTMLFLSGLILFVLLNLI